MIVDQLMKHKIYRAPTYVIDVEIVCYHIKINEQERETDTKIISHLVYKSTDFWSTKVRITSLPLLSFIIFSSIARGIKIKPNQRVKNGHVADPRFIF